MLSTRQSLFWMVIYLAIVIAICTLLFSPLRQAFMANWGFNAVIIGVLLIGIAMDFRQVLVLNTEIDWIRVFRTGQPGLSVTRDPRLLKPLAAHLSKRRRDRFRLTASGLRAILDGIRERLDESREISRYLIGTLIFLGLLGTFWGLLGTVAAVADVIDGLEVGGADAADVFRELKQGLQAPLSGMGTAFSSSLFGLGGSLVLGFLDLQAGHAQNRFFNGLEEWLSGATQLVDDLAAPEIPVEEVPEPTSVTETAVEVAMLERLIETVQQERALLEALLKRQERSVDPDPDPDPGPESGPKGTAG